MTALQADIGGGDHRQLGRYFSRGGATIAAESLVRRVFRTTNPALPRQRRPALAAEFLTLLSGSPTAHADHASSHGQASDRLYPAGAAPASHGRSGHGGHSDSHILPSCKFAQNQEGPPESHVGSATISEPLAIS